MSDTPPAIFTSSAMAEPSDEENARFQAEVDRLMAERDIGTSGDELPDVGFGAGSMVPPSPTPLEVPADSVVEPPPAEGDGVPSPGAVPLEPSPTPEPSQVAGIAPAGEGGPAPVDVSLITPSASPVAPGVVATGDAPVDYERIFTAYLGTAPDPDTIIGLLNFVTDIQQLPTEQQLIIERAMRQDPTLLAQLAAPATPAPAPPTPASTPPDPWGTDDATVDPAYRALLERQQVIEQRLAQEEAHRQQQEAQEQARWIEYQNEVTKQAAVTLATTLHLDATDLAILEGKVRQAGSYSSLLRVHGNDPARAYTAALESAFWSDPQFRARAVAADAQAQATQTATDDTRKVLASAVSASTSAVSAAPVSSPAGPKTMGEAKAQALAETRAMFDANPEAWGQ